MKKILVVDDAELNRELLKDILNDNYMVETAKDGAEALNKLRIHQDELSALLLDLRMPVLDGFSVLKEMKKHNDWMKRFPVLIISSEGAVEVETKCLELGVSDFIHKPFDSSIVKHRIENAIELFSFRTSWNRQLQNRLKLWKNKIRSSGCRQNS